MFTVTTLTQAGEMQRFKYATHKAAHIAARALARQASPATVITLRDALGKLTVSY